MALFLMQPISYYLSNEDIVTQAISTAVKGENNPAFLDGAKEEKQNQIKEQSLKVKMCGMRRKEDIAYANEVKPDAVGYIFFPKSKRYVTGQQAKEFDQDLDQDILSVGVFVNETIEKVIEIANQVPLDVIQLHGDEDHTYVEQLKQQTDKEIWKVVRVKDTNDIKEAEKLPVDKLLLDTFTEEKDMYGGTGKVMNYNLIPKEGISKPFFIAGGLHSKNIKEITKKGQYVPEIVMNAVNELNEAYEKYKNDPEFLSELRQLYRDYANRPSLLYYAEKMTKDLGGAKVYLKREDLNHTGAHKINNVLGQILLAKRMGKKRIIAETGAGQHGVATATGAALFDMECTVFMGAEDIERQKLNVFRMEMLGAKVQPVTTGSATLKDATNEAIRTWAERAEDTFYIIGSAVGPHPYPKMVKEFQRIISTEARKQILEKTGKLPDAVVACVGGGSNSIGMFADFINDKDVDLIGVEAGGLGIETGKHASAMALGQVGVLHGMKTYLLQDEIGNIQLAHSISAGLDYPGVGPEHAYLRDSGRAKYVSVTDKECMEALMELCRMEGIIPAIESAHALAHVFKMAQGEYKGKTIIMCLSGRGDKDVNTVQKYLNGEETNK